MNSPNEVEAAIDAATQAVLVQHGKLEELSPGKLGGESVGLANLVDVPVEVTVEVGRTRVTLGELVKLGPGSLVTLDREAHEAADVLVNGKIVARAEVVTIDDRYGVRITSIVSG
jgi:flagellar motor switch protein FliN/FliY